MMKRLFVLLVVLTLTLSGFAQAADSDDCLAKTWKGTIGNTPITLWFEFEGEGASLVGIYYYGSGPVDLLLIKDAGKPDRWQELDARDKITGYLTLSCKGNVLSGVWSSPDGLHTLPVKAGSHGAGPYSKQRLDGLKPVIAERSSIGGFGYEILAAKDFKSVGGLRLAGTERGIENINNALGKDFRAKLDEAIECFAYGLMRRGRDHGYEYEYSMSMIDWNRSFVVIGSIYSQYCGGIHPLSGSGATTYSVRTGKPENVSLWLIDGYRENIPKESALGKIIMEIYRQEDPDNNECLKVIELSGEGIWPTGEGIVFQPVASHAYSSCIVDITVPYRKMEPYLSPAGKENAKAFR